MCIIKGYNKYVAKKNLNVTDQNQAVKYLFCIKYPELKKQTQMLKMM